MISKMEWNGDEMMIDEMMIEEWSDGKMMIEWSEVMAKWSGVNSDLSSFWQ